MCHFTALKFFFWKTAADSNLPHVDVNRKICSTWRSQSTIIKFSSCASLVALARLLRDSLNYFGSSFKFCQINQFRQRWTTDRYSFFLHMKGNLCNRLRRGEINVTASSPSRGLQLSFRAPSTASTLASHLSSALSAALSLQSHQPWSKDGGRFTHTQLHSLTAFLRSEAVIWKSHIEVCMRARGRTCVRALWLRVVSLRVNAVGLKSGIWCGAATDDYFHELFMCRSFFSIDLLI